MEMATAYHDLSNRIQIATHSAGTLSAGIYVGAGSLVSKATMAVFTCICQKKGLYDEKVRLLGANDEHSCTIENGTIKKA